MNRTLAPRFRSLACVLCAASLPALGRAQGDGTDTLHVPFVTAYAVPMRSAPNAHAEARRLLTARTRVFVSFDAPMEGVYVRASSAERRDSGWVYARALRADPAAIPYDSSLIIPPPRGLKGPPPLFPRLRLPDVLQIPSNLCPPPPVVQRFADDGNWMLRCDMRYANIHHSGVGLTVANGFVTDFASVPGYLRSFFRSSDRFSPAAVLHDFLYWDQTCPKSEADLLFRFAMEEANVRPATKWLFYLAVRLGGGWAWEDNADDKAGGLVRVVPKPYDVVPMNTTWQQYRDTLYVKGVHDASYTPVDRKLCQVH